MCDLFFGAESIDIVSHTDGLHLMFVSKIWIWLLQSLKLRPITFFNEVKANYIFQWFNENTMKANADKCHLLIKTNEERIIFIEREKIQISKSEKLLAVTIDNKLSFPEHVHNICDKASQKPNALDRLSSFCELRKGKDNYQSICSFTIGILSSYLDVS